MEVTDTALAKLFNKTRRTIARFRKSDELFDKVVYAAMLEYIEKMEELK